MDPIMWQKGKAYLWCPDCGKLVQLNKPMFGSLHICNVEEK